MSMICLASRAAKQICRAADVTAQSASQSRGLISKGNILPRWTTRSLWRDHQARPNISARKLPSGARCHQTTKERERQGGRVATDSAAKPRTAGTVVHEDIYTLPNFLTLTRLVAAPVVGYLVLHDSHVWAVGLFAYAGVTDMVDGWIARRWNRKTVVGTIIDPLADKALMTILTVCLAAKGALPIWLATIILARDVGLGIAAIYYRWISLPPPKTFRRYWDFSLPSAEVRPTTISKYNTFLQLGLVGLTTAAPLIDADISSILATMQWVPRPHTATRIGEGICFQSSLLVIRYTVAATTLWSGASYVFSRDAVKILK